ncbi:MAG TPA: hypothetical protein VG755_07525 [Nannocystaceae bacterium]|nr:hypothetical protein [Nannocystaceae bacterium]
MATESPGEGSPYRALEVTTRARSIATAAKPDAILHAVPLAFAIATGFSLLVHALVAALVAGFFAVVFGVGRFVASRVRAPLLEADRGGLRLRCPAAAQTSAPALSTSARVDLVIPWVECEKVAVESRRFDDGVVDVLVITTPSRTIVVRADIFAELPTQIVERIGAAQAELAPARQALR